MLALALALELELPLAAALQPPTGLCDAASAACPAAVRRTDYFMYSLSVRHGATRFALLTFERSHFNSDWQRCGRRRDCCPWRAGESSMGRTGPVFMAASRAKTGASCGA